MLPFKLNLVQLPCWNPVNSSHQTISIVLSILVFGIILFVGIKFSSILKETVTSDDSKKVAYSFSKFQIWLWTLVIIPAFILHWGITDTIEITKTELILLAISSGSAITSSVIKNYLFLNNPAEVYKFTQWFPKKMIVETETKEGKVVPKEGEDQKPVMKELTGFFAFLYEILSDDHGKLSIARLQNLMFTIVFIVIYITMFINVCFKVYPNFADENSNVFLLMGISTSGYLLARAQKQ